MIQLSYKVQDMTKLPSNNENKMVKKAYISIILILGVVSLLLLTPPHSDLSVFSRGEFTYPESLGFIFAYLVFFLVIMYFFFTYILSRYIRKKRIQYVLFGIFLILGIFLLLSITSFAWIRSEVKRECQNAKITYRGDCVESLISQLNDENQDYRSRNNAIYALGQLADDRALPTLKNYYTGKVPQREPLHKTISQYELKKAITWCEKGNVTSWMYWDQANW